MKSKYSNYINASRTRKALVSLLDKAILLIITFIVYIGFINLIGNNLPNVKTSLNAYNSGSGYVLRTHMFLDPLFNKDVVYNDNMSYTNPETGQIEIATPNSKPIYLYRFTILLHIKYIRSTLYVLSLCYFQSDFHHLGKGVLPFS